MKSFVFGVLAAVVLVLSGCGKSSSGEAKNAQAAASAASASVATGTAEAPREIVIEVGDHMRFSVTRIEAAPGETLRVVLKNTGRAPKEAMGHNWVLLRAGADATAYANAAVKAKETDYVPAALAADALAHTRLIGGGARDAVVFTVPADAASGTELIYLCTFPAHLQLGMRGVLVVR